MPAFLTAIVDPFSSELTRHDNPSTDCVVE
jgi:hypothetical protein